MALLADNDVLFKLASCDLLAETLTLLRVEPVDVYVIPTLGYKIKDKRLLDKYGPDGIARITSFLQGVSELKVQPDSEELEALFAAQEPDTGRRLIDAGEQLMFAATRFYANCIVATGDKRCLFGLSSARSCDAIHARLKGRVICLEQILLWLIASEGFDHVLSKVVPVLKYDCDKAIRSAFGSGHNASASNVVYALQMYINEVSDKTAGLLRTSL